MIKSRAIVASLLAIAVFAIAAPAAQASVPAASSKFCTAVQKYTKDLSNIGSSGKLDTARAKAVAVALKRAAKSAPPKVKAATIVVADYLLALANKDSAALSKTVQKFSKAATTFSTYLATSCVAAAN